MSSLTSNRLDHRKFMVTIIETLQRTVEVEADNPHEAEQMVSDGWNSSKHIFGSGDFVDVEFEAALVSDTLG